MEEEVVEAVVEEVVEEKGDQEMIRPTQLFPAKGG